LAVDTEYSTSEQPYAYPKSTAKSYAGKAPKKSRDRKGKEPAGYDGGDGQEEEGQEEGVYPAHPLDPFLGAAARPTSPEGEEDYGEIV
jgi:hypothetical protein